MSLVAVLDFFSFPWENWDLSSPEAQKFLAVLGARLVVLLAGIVFSLLLGRFLPPAIQSLVMRSLPEERKKAHEAFMKPLTPTISIAITLIAIDVSLNTLRAYREVFEVLKFIADLAVTISVAWLLSRAARQMIRIYGVELVKRISQEVNDLVLIFETAINVIIGFFAVTIFAQSKDFNLIALLTGLGIGGIAIAFAAQEALSQILATVVLYLDRPYIPGEYVRVNFNIQAEDVYGRIESIGLRSTKIRIAVSNTLLVVPNSLMVTKDIENISRGTKVMILLYMDFPNILSEGEEALVQQTIESNIEGELFGLDPGSTRVLLFQPDDKPGTRARISFFITGSNEESLVIRKRLWEVASKSIGQQLNARGLEFEMPEPTVYVDSPVTI